MLEGPTVYRLQPREEQLTTTAIQHTSFIHNICRKRSRCNLRSVQQAHLRLCQRHKEDAMNLPSRQNNTISYTSKTAAIKPTHAVHNRFRRRIAKILACVIRFKQKIRPRIGNSLTSAYRRRADIASYEHSS